MNTSGAGRDASLERGRPALELDARTGSELVLQAQPHGSRLLEANWQAKGWGGSPAPPTVRVLIDLGFLIKVEQVENIQPQGQFAVGEGLAGVLETEVEPVQVGCPAQGTARHGLALLKE